MTTCLKQIALKTSVVICLMFALVSSSALAADGGAGAQQESLPGLPAATATSKQLSKAARHALQRKTIRTQARQGMAHAYRLSEGVHVCIDGWGCVENSNSSYFVQENRGCVRAVWSNGHWYTRCETAYWLGGSTYNHSVFSYWRLDRVWVNYMNVQCYGTGAGYGSVTGCHQI
jgi:hypothetical protein